MALASEARDREFKSRHPDMSQNYIGFYDLDVLWIKEGVGEWQVTCHRCALKEQTSRVGPYKSSPDLVMLINMHVCDPSKRAKN